MDQPGHRRRPALSADVPPAGVVGSSGPAGPGPSRRLALYLVAVVLLVEMAIAFFPFRLDPPRRVDNDVSRTTSGGLRFGEHNRAETAVAPSWIPAARHGSSVAVSLAFVPAVSDQDGPARIFTVSDGFFHGDLTVGQDDDALVVRVRRPGADQAGWPDLRVPGALEAGRPVVVDVVVAPGSIRIAVDGKTALRRRTSSVPASRWNPTYRLALGNELGGGRPWEGEISRAEVRVDGRTYDYLRPGALVVPADFWYATHRRWEPVLPGSGTDVATGLAHVALFAPLGAVLAAAMPRRRLITVTAAAGLVALALTVAKTAFAGRHPSLGDVVWQTAGAWCGAALFRWVVARRDVRHITNAPSARETTGTGATTRPF